MEFKIENDSLTVNCTGSVNGEGRELPRRQLQREISKRHYLSRFLKPEKRASNRLPLSRRVRFRAND